MNKVFLLLFSLFCLIVAAASLKCVTCHLHTQTDHCRRGFGVCVAKNHEKCMTLQIYHDNELQLSYMLCQKFCNNLSYDRNNRTYVHTCCETNFCNYKI